MEADEEIPLPGGGLLRASGSSSSSSFSSPYLNAIPSIDDTEMSGSPFQSSINDSPMTYLSFIIIFLFLHSF